jgi:hypothetical protein
MIPLKVVDLPAGNASSPSDLPEIFAGELWGRPPLVVKTPLIAFMSDTPPVVPIGPIMR